MIESLTLHGYRYSVYTRIARIVLHEKGVEHAHVEVDPFAESSTTERVRMHPFGRVPVLDHDGFVVYETAAIARYVDAAFPGRALLPTEPRALARVAQVVGIVDSYGYWPMVRQVFSHAVFRPLEGETSSRAEIAAGLEGSRHALAALDAIASEGRVLSAQQATLADYHLAPMIDYFVRSEEGARMLDGYPSLARWWMATLSREWLASTDPALRERS